MSKCAQGPPAIEVERSLVVTLHIGLCEGQRVNALKVQLRLKDVVGLYEGRRTNVLKVQLRLKGVVGLREGRGANLLKVHQKLRLVGLRDMNGWNN